jgi:uncharacterized protein YciI
MPRLFVVINTRGPTWDDSVPMEKQPEWIAHAAFMDDLEAEGFVRLGGPLEGTPDVVLVLEAEDRAEIERRLAPDPWVQNGFLVMKECRPWQIRLGSLG